MPTGLEDFSAPAPEEEHPKRALVVAAHPDDSEFGAGGTVALWSRQGWEIYYLISTDGSKGSDDPEMTVGKLVAQRREEERAAARVLGVKEVFFLDYVDGELTYTREYMRDVVRYIRMIKPHTVFSHHPSQIVGDRFINHPDHRCAGTVALDAVYPIARNRPSFPELLADGLEPHSAREVYLWTMTESNLEVDITAVADLKFEALMQHRSQFADIEGNMSEWRKRWAEPDGRYLERFFRIQMMF